jgi:hypothetical protein
LLFNHSVDGKIVGQPLYIPNLPIPGHGTHNVVFVATEADTVYAFDADDNTGPNANPLWTASLIDTAHGAAPGGCTAPNFTSCPVDAVNDLDCTIMPPTYGISSTPVIDVSTRTMYVEARSRERGKFIHRLHALNIANGVEKFSGPVVIAATAPGKGALSDGTKITFDSQFTHNRPALLLLNSTVYIAFASNGCDDNPGSRLQKAYHGWVFAYNAANLALKKAVLTTPNGEAGGIWMSGAGLAGDTDGSIFFATGNGDFETTLDAQGFPMSRDFGDSILKLRGSDLAPLDYFAPSNQPTLLNEDEDLGSGGLLLFEQPGSAHPHLLAQAGKEGSIYLLDRTQLGKYRKGANGSDLRVDEMLNPNPGTSTDPLAGMWGMPAYWNNTLYFWGTFDLEKNGSEVLKAFPISNGKFSGSRIDSTVQYGYPGAGLSISASGNSNGIVWAVGHPFGSNGSVLQAFDASNIAAVPLYASDNLGAIPNFVVPTVINGKVYVGTSDHLAIFGLPPNSVATVTVNKSGTGTGIVSSDPAGVACGTTCSVSFPAGTSVTLIAAPSTGSTFTGWSGSGCSGTSSCTVVLTQNRTVTAGFTGTNGSQFVSQSVPGSMIVGNDYNVSVTMKNTGTTTWTAGEQYKLGAQNPQDNTTWGLNRVFMPGNVAPGAQGTFNFTVTAPPSPGAYNFQWRMVQENVQWFGAFSRNVVVAVNTQPTGTQATASVTIDGTDQSTQVCPNSPTISSGGCIRVWDHGTVSITVNGVTETVNYNHPSTPDSLATNLANSFNADPNSPVTATASTGGVVNLTSKATGPDANYPLSADSATGDPDNFDGASFSATPSGPSLTGGK